jgi:tRNA A-37 threonylcarbamoyl transferase component Bud32
MVWVAGQQLQNGKYQIETVLGKGGFGITYKALQFPLEQQVVIKTLNESYRRKPDYDKYVERFIKEGQILARLSEDPHPNIVGVIDLFQEGEIYCLVMDYIDGETLFDLVKRRGALPETEILECFRQIGEALTVVHKAGLVHRDAHPGNIMLRPNGKAVLIDFGIAGELLPATETSIKPYNRGFAPYEQRNGDRNPTVDVYCLSATLYYAVTGQKPATALDRKLNNVHLIPPQEIVPSISDKLNTAILKGMALEAKNRPQTIPALLNLLGVSPSVKPLVVESPIHWIIEAWQFIKTQVVKLPVPWLALIGYILLYAGIGFLLSISNTEPQAAALGGSIGGMGVIALFVFLNKATTADLVVMLGAIIGTVFVALCIRTASNSAITISMPWVGLADLILTAGIAEGSTAWTSAEARAKAKDEAQNLANLKSRNEFYSFAATIKAESEARAKARAMLESRMRTRVMVIAGTTAVAGTLVMNWIWYEHWTIAILLAVAICCVGNSKNDTVVNNLSVAVSGLGGGALLGGFLGVITGNDIFVGFVTGAWTVSIAVVLFFINNIPQLVKLPNH